MINSAYYDKPLIFIGLYIWVDLDCFWHCIWHDKCCDRKSVGGFKRVQSYSNYLLLETCRCPKTLYSSWMQLPPLIDAKKKGNGILPKYVDAAIKTCCGTCANGIGSSHIDWVNNGFNSSSLQHDSKTVRDSVFFGTHIALPIYRDSLASVGSVDSPFIFVPMISSPGVAIFRVKPTLVVLGNISAANLTSSILELLTLLTIMILLTTLAGILIYAFVRIHDVYQKE